jgi:hypothetical protein
VSAAELTSAYEALRIARAATDGSIAQTTSLGVEKSRTALSHLCQVGRAMYDLKDNVYRHRELFAQAFSVTEAVKAVQQAAEEADPQAKAARRIFEQDQVRIIARRPVSTGFKLSGSTKGDDETVRVRPMLHADPDGKIIEASCTCEDYRKFKMTRGPCQHILALRLAHMSRLEAEKKGG